jgi:hypothetical protein
MCAKSRTKSVLQIVRRFQNKLQIVDARLGWLGLGWLLAGCSSIANSLQFHCKIIANFGGRTCPYSHHIAPTARTAYYLASLHAICAIG